MRGQQKYDTWTTANYLYSNKDLNQRGVYSLIDFTQDSNLPFFTSSLTKQPEMS